MPQGLYDHERRSLARVAVMLVLGASAVLSMSGQSSSMAAARASADKMRRQSPFLPQPLEYASFTIRRDPFQENAPPTFEGRLGDERKVSTAGEGVTAGLELPPNAGVDPDALLFGEISADDPKALLRAIVLGPHPRALIDIGGVVRVLGIGDSISGQRLTSIDADGITLSDGIRIALEGPK